MNFFEPACQEPTINESEFGISVLRHAVMFPGFAGAGKSVSSYDPLSYFGTTKSFRTSKYLR